MRHSFHAKQWLPCPKEQVFAFFADPANLPPLMPPWQQTKLERVNRVAPSAPDAANVAAGEGSVITISFRPIPGIPWRLEWDACITKFRWNDFFCDEQRRGPFRYFHHCHRILEEENGSIVSDAVEYELPLGILGDLANGLAVRRQIKALFRHRQKMLLKLLIRKEN
jgi:ligand-binding SRPBCC domain-containing protein